MTRRYQAYWPVPEPHVLSIATNDDGTNVRVQHMAPGAVEMLVPETINYLLASLIKLTLSVGGGVYPVSEPKLKLITVNPSSNRYEVVREDNPLSIVTWCGHVEPKVGLGVGFVWEQTGSERLCRECVEALEDQEI